MELWFSSDPHFSHKHIISYCDRPFKDENEMDEFLISQHNSRVRKGDHWYCLGDVSMIRPRDISHLLKRMNGRKRLVRGNHDIFKTKEYIEAGFEEIYGIRVLDNLLLTHIPVHPSSLGGFDANVHGHIHNNQGKDFPPVMKMNKATQAIRWVPYINVSVEVIDYAPVTLEWIKRRIKDETES